MKHTCHARNCAVAVPPKLFMCKRHWFQLPKRLRDQIWRTYQPGQERGDAEVTRAYLDAADEAIEWLFQHELEKTRQGKLL